jgi:hypothetical protein
MSKVVYLLGAGASRGKRDGDNDPHYSSIDLGESHILEGLPLVSEIPDRLEYIIEEIKKITYNNSLNEFSFMTTNNDKYDNIENTKSSFITDLQWLKEESSRHATIDTFAKKLFLKHKDKDFKKLKALLALFFMIEQFINKPDNRYDTFFANILDSSLKIPNDISILTWNYDSQFEIAYKEYAEHISDIRGDLGVLDLKGKEDYAPIDNPRIFKINGTANFLEESSLANRWDGKGLTPQSLFFILNSYHECLIKDFMGDFTRLAFAWSHEQNNQFMDKIKSSVNVASSVVIIGYTFPFFNREIDREIFSSMLYLRHIYIQDPNAVMIKQTIPSVLNSHNNTAEIIPITNVNQFYLPPDL